MLDSVTESRVHNDVNELTQRTIGQGGAIDLSYDDAGNLIQDGTANGDHQYVWDYRNRLVQAKEKQAGDWNTVGTYKYDPQGRRVRKAVTNKGGLNGTTRFLWGGDSDWQCLEERDADDNLVARLTYSPGYIDGVAVQERDLNDDDDFSDANEVAYYEANTLFSVYVLSDADGSVIERYRFDAYGGATVLDADGGADADGLSDVKNPYTFTARRLDPESGLMQYRYRYYSAAIGRFVSRDPVAYSDGYDLYAYVGSWPTETGDPTGLSLDDPEWRPSADVLIKRVLDRDIPITILPADRIPWDRIPEKHWSALKQWYGQQAPIKANLHQTVWERWRLLPPGKRYWVLVFREGRTSFSCPPEGSVPDCPPRMEALLFESKCCQNVWDWRWCEEEFNPLHSADLICFREHPCGEQRKSQHCCYHEDGSLEKPSPDYVSPVEPGPGKGRYPNGYCDYSRDAMEQHIIHDVIPGLAVEAMKWGIKKALELREKAVEDAKERARRQDHS